MAATLESPAAPASLSLVETLDMKAATGLASELLTLRGRDLAIDASQVRRIGAQCLQVLLAARVSWSSDGQSLIFNEPSDAFLEGIGLLGAADLCASGAD